MAGPLSIGTFFGVYLISKPKLMLGDVELEKLANGVELLELYEASQKSVDRMRGLSLKIEDKTLRDKALGLASIGQDILKYLENNPTDLSGSRHFLTYYINSANKILENYIRLNLANVSQEKFNLVSEKTLESLDLLTQVFSRQRDSYHKDVLMELEVEADLLEKTIKLGGDE